MGFKVLNIVWAKHSDIHITVAVILLLQYF